MPQFVMVNEDVSLPVLIDYTLTELNGRTDYCFNVSGLDCKSSDVETYVIRGDAYVGMRFVFFCYFFIKNIFIIIFQCTGVLLLSSIL
jgi:hypothetical protein